MVARDANLDPHMGAQLPGRVRVACTVALLIACRPAPAPAPAPMLAPAPAPAPQPEPEHEPEHEHEHEHAPALTVAPVADAGLTAVPARRKRKARLPAVPHGPNLRGGDHLDPCGAT